MVKKLAIIREILKGDHNAAAVVRKLTRNQISALSGTLDKTTAVVGSPAGEQKCAV